MASQRRLVLAAFLAGWTGGGRRGGVVALASFYGYGGAGYLDFYFVVGGGGTGASRDVGECVFVAGFFGDLRIEFFDAGAGGGVVDVAARIVRVVDQAGELVLGDAVADCQAIDRNIVVQESLERVLIGEVIELGAVHTVGNDEDNFAAGEAAVVE